MIYFAPGQPLPAYLQEAQALQPLQPLQPVLSNPVLTPAFDNVVPALFGALGCKYFIKGKKFAAIPLVLSSAVCILMPSLIRQTSVLLIVIGALTIGVSFIFYKKGALEE